MTTKVLIFSVLILSLTGCRSNPIELSATDYIVFGHYYGECMGNNCIEIFRLEKDYLFEDTTDVYPSGRNFYNGKYITLPDSDFQKTKDLIDYFPKALLTEKDTVIGMPDATDGGGLYIEYNYEGTHKFWLIDNFKTNVPSKYHNFMDKVTEKINRLQN